MSVTILGIESSCDDTSSSVIRDGVMLSNVIASQAVHEAYGGVVPELASRAHQQNIIPVVAEAIKRAGIDKSELSAVAFTRGPGLMGSLLVGTSFAKGLAASLDIPMTEINHLQAHVWPHVVEVTPGGRRSCSFVPVPLPVGIWWKLADYQGERIQRYGGDRTDDRRCCR